MPETITLSIGKLILFPGNTEGTYTLENRKERPFNKDYYKYEAYLEGKTIEVYLNYQIVMHACVDPFILQGEAIEVEAKQFKSETYVLDDFTVHTTEEMERLRKEIERAIRDLDSEHNALE